MKKKLIDTASTVGASMKKKAFSKVGLPNKSLCLAAALDVTKFTTVVSQNLVTICCAA